MAANEVERRRWNDAFWTDAWPKRESLTDACTPHLLRAADLQPGERVLEIGPGGGRVAITVARLVAPGGAVVGADISATMLALAGARAAGDPGLDLTFVQADMQTDTVPGAPFDAAISQMGVMFFEDPVAAFANIRAHLRPGGRLAFACFQEMPKNRWWFAPVLAPYLPPPPPPSPGKHATGPFSLADAEATRAILAGAGFADITHTPIEETVEAPESAVVDEPQLAFMGVPEGRRAEALEAVRAFMAQFRQPSGLSGFPTAVQVFTARNP